MKTLYFYGAILSFAISIALSEFYPTFVLAMFWSIASIFIFLSIYFFSRPRTINKAFIAVTIFTIFLSLGSLRYESALPEKDSRLIALDGKQIEIRARIVSNTERRENNLKIIAQLQSVATNNHYFDTDAKVVIFIREAYNISYGDTVYISGRLNQPQSFESTNGRLFDYAGFLIKDGITFELMANKIEIIEQSNISVKKILFAFKEKYQSALQKIIPEPHVSLLSGIIIGDKGLDKNWQEIFRKSGLIHIIVLSGYNMALVASTIIALLAFLPRRIGLICATIAIILFATMAGGGATVIRASIMASLAIGAKFTSKKYEAGRALFFAGGLMVMQNPLILFHDPSFELSFIATAGLVYLSPIVEKFCRWITESLKLREIVVSTIATQIAVLPLLIYLMGNFSIIGLFTNILVLPVVPLIMILGFSTGFLSLIWLPLAIPFGYIVYGLLQYVFTISKLGANLPFSIVEVGSISPMLLFLMYTVLIFAFFGKTIILNLRKIVFYNLPV